MAVDFPFAIFLVVCSIATLLATMVYHQALPFCTLLLGSATQ